MFREAVDDRDDPLLAGDCLIKLLCDDVIVLESLADSHELALIRVDAGSVCLLFGFDAIQRQRIDNHIPCHGVAQIICARIVIIFDFVLT